MEVTNFNNKRKGLDNLLKPILLKNPSFLGYHDKFISQHPGHTIIIPRILLKLASILIYRKHITKF